MIILIACNENGRIIGQSHAKAKLSDEDVDLIRTLREDHGMKIRELVEKFDVCRSTIIRICTYKSRAQTPMKYKTKQVKDEKVNT